MTDVAESYVRRFALPLKPTDYELFVQQVLTELADDHTFDVFHQREYVGKISGRRITIDVSFEFEIFRARILVLVECKHYNRRVEVGDVEEFYSKLSDIGAHKGMVVTTIGFQDGAVRAGLGRGMALARLNPEPQPGELIMIANSATKPSYVPPSKDDTLLQGSLQDDLLTHGGRIRFNSAQGLWSVFFSGFAPYIDDNGNVAT